MFKTGILLLTILTISGCRSVETAVVCSEVKHNEIAPVEKCAIDFKNGWCRCFMFDLNRWLQTSEPKDYDLEYCDGIQGARIETEAIEVRPKVKALWRLKENLCGDQSPRKKQASKTLSSPISTPRMPREREFYSH